MVDVAALYTTPLGLELWWSPSPRTALRLSWASKCSPFGAKNPLVEGIISSPLADRIPFA